MSTRGAASVRPAASAGWIGARWADTAGWPGPTPRPPTPRCSGFPPLTWEIQFDEKWSFVAKKEAYCDRSDPTDNHDGDWWVHVAYNPEHRLILAVVPGAQTIDNTEILVEKVRAKRRVVRVGSRVVFGTLAAVALALGLSKVSRAINTPFIERENGTDRHRNASKARRSYRFSKDWRCHEAATYFTMYSYNFCWAVRTLALKDEHGLWGRRSPAMAAGLTDHLWSMAEWLSYPAVPR